MRFADPMDGVMGEHERVYGRGAVGAAPAADAPGRSVEAKSEHTWAGQHLGTSNRHNHFTI